MADKYLKQFIILNLILAILIVEMIFAYGFIIGIVNIIILFVFSGFASSFFVRENSFLSYFKQMALSASLFSILFIAAFSIYLNYIGEEFWQGRDIFDAVTIFVIVFIFLGFLNLVGALIGIIPKAIAERIAAREVI